MRETARPRRIPSAAILLSVFASAVGRAALAVPPDAPKPGEASGTFSVDGKTVTLHFAYAMIQPDSFDEKKTNTAILLAEKPLPDAALAAAKDLEAAGRGQTNWILVKLDEKGSAIREVVHHDSLGDASLQMSGMTHSDVKAAAGKDRVEGSLRTKEAEDFVRHEYQTEERGSAVKAAGTMPAAARAKPMAATTRRATLRLPVRRAHRSDVQPPARSPAVPARSGRLA